MKNIKEKEGVINIIYHPSTRGYSSYSHELDGLQTDAETVSELMKKVEHLLEIRIETLKEIGQNAEAKKLENQKEVLLEERSVAILVGRRIEEKKSRSEKKPIYTVKTQNVNKIEKRQEAEELCKEEQPAREGKV